MFIHKRTDIAFIGREAVIGNCTVTVMVHRRFDWLPSIQPLWLIFILVATCYGNPSWHATTLSGFCASTIGRGWKQLVHRLTEVRWLKLL